MASRILALIRKEFIHGVHHAADAELVGETLREAGIRGATITPIVPSLEDVFLTIVANQRLHPVSTGLSVGADCPK